MTDGERKLVTENGVPVYVYPNPALHGFYLSLFVRGGSMYEDEATQGIGHFFEHIALRNVNALYDGKLYTLLDRYGLEFNATTYAEMIHFFLSGATEHFSRAAEMLTAVLSPLVLSRHDVDLERARIKAEIREGDEKNTLANFTGGVLYPDSTLRFPIVGTTGSVSRVSVRALEEYRARTLTPENLFFYVTGNVPEEGLSALCRSIESHPLLTGVPRCNLAPVPAAFGKREGKVHVKPADYTVLRFNFDMDMSCMSEAETDLLYDYLLGGYNSRFFIEMSEDRGLFYDVGGSLERYSNIGNFYFSFEVMPKDIYEAAELTVALLNEAKTVPPREEALSRATYVDNAGMLLDDVREMNFTFAYSPHILGVPYSTLAQRQAAYRAVTPERLCEVASRIFRYENCTLTMKGNRRKTDVARLEEILKKLKSE